MTYETILYSVADQIATITLNRPDKMNAFTARMGAEIGDAMLRADEDRTARVIIMTGAGDRAFCAGADIGGFARDIKAREGDKVEGEFSGGRSRQSAALPLLRFHRHILQLSPDHSWKVEPSSEFEMLNSAA